MRIVNTRLLITRPTWQGLPDRWFRACEQGARALDVHCLFAPFARLDPIDEAREQSLAAALTALGPRPLWLVATSPASAEALGLCPRLLRLLTERQNAPRLAATGASSAQALRGVLGRTESEVLLPAQVGDAASLAELLRGRAREEEAVVLLEGLDNRPDLAEALGADGLLCLPLALYTRTPITLAPLPPEPSNWWALLSSSAAVAPVLAGLSAQGIDAGRVHFMGHHPAIFEALRLAQPTARYEALPSLALDEVLSRITLMP